jgi:hypothetical protein
MTTLPRPVKERLVPLIVAGPEITVKEIAKPDVLVAFRITGDALNGTEEGGENVIVWLFWAVIVRVELAEL